MKITERNSLPSKRFVAEKYVVEEPNNCHEMEQSYADSVNPSDRRQESHSPLPRSHRRQELGVILI